MTNDKPSSLQNQKNTATTSRQVSLRTSARPASCTSTRMQRWGKPLHLFLLKTSQRRLLSSHRRFQLRSLGSPGILRSGNSSNTGDGALCTNRRQARVADIYTWDPESYIPNSSSASLTWRLSSLLCVRQQNGSFTRLRSHWRQSLPIRGLQS